MEHYLSIWDARSHMCVSCSRWPSIRITNHNTVNFEFIFWCLFFVTFFSLMFAFFLPTALSFTVVFLSPLFLNVSGPRSLFSIPPFPSH
ncbi:hypothetical protein BDZ94DRAFT_1039321 [Collybia nuda]|uniref:Uncharacterized protein n=1 Tax=Collybia nuda TaxID=64659 RepID=A0A9P5YF74_9AGAR|nr:hypothetical protein BDZ94DRAFT_1039321 [Collybia nuda]